MNSPNEQTSVRAIDVGYGNVKYSLHHRDMTGPVVCENFPSHSPIASDKALAAGVMKGRDTVAIKINGISYEVGKQVTLALAVDDKSVVLGKDFCQSDAYLARLRGALFYMRGKDKDGINYTPENIQLLVVGLPVSTYRDKDLVQKLKERVLGFHELPEERSVNVEKVIVLPQPMGAFFQHAISKDLLLTMRNQTNLIVDPGYYTFDWLFSAGMTPVDVRSDSANRGVSAILEIMAHEVIMQEKFDANESTLIRMLEAHYMTGVPFVPFGVNIDMPKYEAHAASVINDAVAAMAHKVGDGADIHNILLAGGGAKFFKAALEKQFPRHKVLIMTEPVYSNVRGFHMAGEQTILAQRVSTRKAAAK